MYQYFKNSRIVDENVKGRSEVRLTVEPKNVSGVVVPDLEIRNLEDDKCKAYRC